MRIKTQLMVTMLIFGVILTGAAVSAIITNRQTQKASDQERIASNIAEQVSELTYLSSEYVIHGESQHLDRWRAKFASLSGEISGLQVRPAEQQALVRHIESNQVRLKEVFDSIVPTLTTSSEGQNPAVPPALFEVSWSRMAVQSQELFSDASRLSALLHAEADHIKRRNLVVTLGMVGALGSYFLVNHMVMQRRVLRSVAALQAGTQVVGSGNLDFSIEAGNNDEIGDLSQAFNEMTTNLRTVTASKKDLEREIAERKEAEEELKRSEERFRSALDSMMEGCQIISPDWRYVYVNDAAARHGRRSREELLGHTMMEIYPGIDDTGMFVQLRTSMEKRVPHRMENEFVYPDGSRGWFDLSIEPVPEGIFILSLDITARRHAEQQAQQHYQAEKELRQKLEGEMDRRVEFLRALVHELRTPLTPVLASSELLVEELKEGVPRRLAQNVFRGATELNGRVDELLDLARGEVGMLRLNLRPTNALGMLREVASNVGPVALARKLSVIFNLPDSLPWVMADADRVRQVLLNLIDNAFKFTPPGGTITLSAREEAESIVVDVRDTGRGISEEDQKELFQPYHRLVTDRERFSGLGLGLALSKTIVELHGGRIWVTSRKGAGSTFTFSLPAKRDLPIGSTAQGAFR